VEPDPAPPTRAASAAVSVIGLDHARLCYAYLNSGDIDGYASLFAADAVVRHPGATPIRGRTALEHGRHPRGTYHLRTAFSSADRVATIGCFVDDDPDQRNVEFADIFTIGNSGLIVAQSTYYFVAPSAHPFPHQS